jgi:5'-3' exonuclease
MTEQTLLLIDGMSTIRRVYEANDETDPVKKVQKAMHSSYASIRNALEEHPHTHALIAIDHGGETWRHRLFAEYKANRDPMPPELRAAIPDLLKKLRENLSLFSLSIPGVEADDVIATCVRRWLEGKKGKVVVISTDKDLVWLAAHGARVWHHFDRVWRDEEWCLNKFGVYPGQILDFLALIGDTSDNIPGLYRCGAKTAAKWLGEYHTLAGVLENADKIPGKIGQKLRDDIEIVKLSRKLTMLHSAVKCGITWGDLRR